MVFWHLDALVESVYVFAGLSVFALRPFACGQAIWNQFWQTGRSVERLLSENKKHVMLVVRLAAIEKEVDFERVQR